MYSFHFKPWTFPGSRGSPEAGDILGVSQKLGEQRSSKRILEHRAKPGMRKPWKTWEGHRENHQKMEDLSMFIMENHQKMEG